MYGRHLWPPYPPGLSLKPGRRPADTSTYRNALSAPGVEEAAVTGTILVIEDDAELAGLYAFVLRLEGYTVHLAASGEEGLVLWRDVDPDLIVLDIMLPGMDGWEICRRVRKDSPVPILILSARSSELDMVRGLVLGADEYLCKPFAVFELSTTVSELLQAAPQRRERASQPA